MILERDKSFLLYLIGGFFLGGVLIRSFFFSLGDIPLLLLALAIALGVGLFFYRRKGVVLLILIVFVSLSLGVIRHEIDDSHREHVLTRLISAEMKRVGTVVASPLRTGTHTRLTVEFSKGVHAYLYTDPYASYSYGDRLRITGDITLPENFVTETGRLFIYDEYLAKDNVYVLVYYPEVQVLYRNGGSRFERMFVVTKHACEDILKTLLPEPHASIMAGILLGSRHALGDDLEDMFRDAGIIHIVVLSGHNMTIAGQLIMFLFGFLGRHTRAVMGALGIVSFALLAGPSSTVIRATLMALIALGARGGDRKSTYALRALLCAGLVMVAVNPRILVFDPSFQLSFLATLGLITYSAPFERSLARVPERFGIRGIIATTLSTQILVMPLLIYMMGTFSLVALPVNILVLPLIPLAMVFGSLTILFGSSVPSLGVFSGYGSYLIIEYVLRIAEYFARCPCARLPIAWFPWWLMIVVYAVILFVSVRILRKHMKRRGALRDDVCQKIIAHRIKGDDA